MLRTCYPLLFVLVFLSGRSRAQSPLLGTEWIKSQQTYFKIPVVQPGIYRLTSAELEKAGLPTAIVDPATIQLFHRGIEQAVYITGGIRQTARPGWLSGILRPGQ